jgi:hypothetical protein
MPVAVTTTFCHMYTTKNPLNFLNPPLILLLLLLKVICLLDWTAGADAA